MNYINSKIIAFRFKLISSLIALSFFMSTQTTMGQYGDTMENRMMGDVMLFAGTFAPYGFLECNGNPLKIGQYPTLFAVIGTQYGGDGRSQFNLPKITPPLPKMRYVMSVNGVFPRRGDGTMSIYEGSLIGEVMLFTGDFVPENWMECNGEVVSIKENYSLYSILGTIYGGDGKNNFALPKLDAPANTKYIICVRGEYPNRN